MRDVEMMNDIMDDVVCECDMYADMDTDSDTDTDTDTAVCSDTAAAKKSLYALVEKVNADKRCGYTEAQMQQIVKNLYHTCKEQVEQDKAIYYNRRSLLHSDVLEAAQTMCLLGLKKMDKFDAEKANFSTFMNTVFMNECKNMYEKRSKDLRTNAASTSAVIGSSDEGLTLEDLIGVVDNSAELNHLRAAQHSACVYLLQYAEDNMTDDEYMIFVLHQLEGKKNSDIAKALGCDKRVVENAYYRAMTRLRKDAAAGLNKMLQKNMGIVM